MDRYLTVRERTIIGSVLYRNRYWVYHIESYRLLLYRPILRASLQVHQLLTDRITHDDHRAFKRPVTRPPRAHACVLFYGPWYGRGLEGREAEGDCHGVAGIRLQRWRSTGLGHHHAALPPPAGSDNNSQLSITLTFLRINQSCASDSLATYGAIEMCFDWLIDWWNWLSTQVCLLLMVCMCHPLRISCVL